MKEVQNGKEFCLKQMHLLNTRDSKKARLNELYKKTTPTVFSLFFQRKIIDNV